MVRLLVILLLLVVGLGALAVAAISTTLKLIGALFWIVLALGAYVVWRGSSRPGA
jgi:hypothetical protein